MRRAKVAMCVAAVFTLMAIPIHVMAVPDLTLSMEGSPTGTAPAGSNVTLTVKRVNSGGGLAALGYNIKPNESLQLVNVEYTDFGWYKDTGTYDYSDPKDGATSGTYGPSKMATFNTTWNPVGSTAPDSASKTTVQTITFKMPTTGTFPRWVYFDFDNVTAQNPNWINWGANQLHVSNQTYSIGSHAFAVQVPEPVSLSLLLAGMGVVMARRRSAR